MNDFSEKLNQLHQIVLSRFVYLDFAGNLTWTYTITGDKVTKESRRYFDEEAPEAPAALPTWRRYTAATLIRKLAELHIERWPRQSDAIGVCDGMEWHLEFRFNDGSKKKYWGSNAVPENFHQFLGVLGITREFGETTW